jgi:HEAT repeat protein
VPPEDEEPSVGDLVERLVDDGKAYARAEAALARARIDERVAVFRPIAIYGGAAAAVALTALIAFAVTLVLALASLVGPLGGGLLATALLAATAAALAYVARRKLETGGE